MKFFALSSIVALPVLALVAGCAASSGDADAAADEALTSRPQIELASSTDKASLQGKLFALLDAFKGDAELDVAGNGAALTLDGAREPNAPARSITCNEARLVHATVGAGVTTTASFACTLNGFDTSRNGGALPNVVVPNQGEPPLAGKLTTLLMKGAQKGGLGVKRSTADEHPPCCDRPTTTTYSISDERATLSCTMQTGGFAFVVRASCSYELADRNEPKVQKGTLFHSVGIGGETTGFSATIDGKSVELVLHGGDEAKFVDGRVARITGAPTTLSGVETHGRPAIDVSNLLVCPAPKTTVNLMPPVADDTAWLAANCPDLDVVE